MIGLTFQNFQQIEQLKNHIKVSDTSFLWNNSNTEYSILYLQEKLNNLVILYTLTIDSINHRTFKLLETLRIPILNKLEYISIGYCDIDYISNGNIR